jgi:hypothetical protein
MDEYEYMTVTYIHSKDTVTGKRSRHYHIWRPDAREVEERVATVQPALIFNELGREGWKLVAAEFLRTTTIMAEGMDDVTHPIRIRWTFMRGGSD